MQTSKFKLFYRINCPVKGARLFKFRLVEPEFRNLNIYKKYIFAVLIYRTFPNDMCLLKTSKAIPKALSSN